MNKTQKRDEFSLMYKFTSIVCGFLIVLVGIRLSMASNEDGRSSCTFCNIVNKLEPTEILYEDNDLCVFRDIKPASRLHVLIIPKEHIKDARSLNATHRELLTKMIERATSFVKEKGIKEDEARFGFHWPPFTSVKHLHLHAIAPVSEMSWISSIIFKLHSFWFVSPEYVMSRL